MAPRSDTERRRPAATLALAAVALASAFLVGLAVNRGTTRATSSAPSGGRHAAETAEAAAPPGPTSIVGGAPAGFARTRGGAVTAATAFVTTGQTLVDIDPLAAEMAVRQMASTAGADRQVRDTLDDLARLREVLRSGSGPIVFRQGVLATRVVAYADGAATVEVWSVGVLARRGVAPPQAGWRISRLELMWERGDWHLDRETVQPGPAPVLDDSAVPATADQLFAALDGFDRIGITAQPGTDS